MRAQNNPSTYFLKIVDLFEKFLYNILVLTSKPNLIITEDFYV